MKKMKVTRTALKVSTCFALGIMVALYASWLGAWRFSPLIGWNTAALLYVTWIWSDIYRMDAENTKSHALSEDPGKAGANILLLLASLGSLVAIAVLIIQVGDASGITKVLEIILGLISVVVSWLIVQTVHTLRYAEQYYGEVEGGIDFNQSSPPRYSDFVYMAFTIGMTFQVSDTSIQNSNIRHTAIKHALLSYLFGTIIIATTIGAIVGLASS